MKIAFVNVTKEELNSPPLNLGFLSSYLKKCIPDIGISILDTNIHNIENELARLEPDIVGITSTTATIKHAYMIADFAKGNLKSKVVMGGVHVSTMPDEALKHCDIVVKGEGEMAMVDIIRNDIQRGKVEKDYIKNLDDIPMIDWSMLDMKFYITNEHRLVRNWQFTKEKAIILVTSRGCPNRCVFCHNTWRGTPVRYQSAERVISEIEYLIKNYGVKAIMFQDDEFLTNKPRLQKICELIKEKHIEFDWACSGRVNNIDEATLQMLKDTGCKMVGIGFESNSQRMLDFMNKCTTTEQNQKAIDICNKVGMKVISFFIFGTPTETIDDIKDTLNFIKRNKIKYYAPTIMTAFPGTSLWQWCVKNGYLNPDTVNYDDYNYSSSGYINKDIPRDVFMPIFKKISFQAALSSSNLLFKLQQNPIKVARYLFNMIKVRY